MNIVVVAAQSWDGTTIPSAFAVEADGVALSGITVPVDAFTVPDGTQRLRVVATPKDPHFFGDEAALLVNPAGDLDPVVNDAAKASTQSAGAGVVVINRVTITLARLRVVSDQAREQLTRQPATRKGKPTRKITGQGDFPPDEWSVPDRPGIHFVDAENPILGDIVATVQHDASVTDSEHVVVELAGVKVPKLLAVSWPLALTRDADAAPTPFLVYYHPGTGQNVENGFYVAPGLDPYPWNFDFCFFVLYNFLWYEADPLLRNPFAKGVPFQVAQGGKDIVTVVPMNAPVGNEFGAFTDAASIQTILLDLQALMFRKAGAAASPTELGHTAIGAFSSGNNFVALLLANAGNLAHHFCTDVLKELYFFDPPGDVIDGLVTAALAWSGTDPGRRVALYGQGGTAVHQKVLDATPPPAPYVASPSNTRTSAMLPVATWRKTLKELTGNDSSKWGWQETHQVISAMMLTHAIHTSQF